MRQELCIVMLAVIMSGLARSQPAPDSGRVAAAKKEVLQLLIERREATRKHDRAALERIFADEFLFLHSLGSVTNKEDQIREAMSSPTDTEPAISLPEIEKITVYGDFAMFTRQLETDFFTNIFVKRDGRWQILLAQGTRLLPRHQAVAVDVKALGAYAGKYEQGPGQFATVTVHSDGLRIVFPKGSVWTVRPLGDDHFFVPDRPFEIIFHKADDGRVKYYTALARFAPNVTVIKGRKVD